MGWPVAFLVVACFMVLSSPVWVGGIIDLMQDIARRRRINDARLMQSVSVSFIMLVDPDPTEGKAIKSLRAKAGRRAHVTCMHLTQEQIRAYRSEFAGRGSLA